MKDLRQRPILLIQNMVQNRSHIQTEECDETRITYIEKVQYGFKLYESIGFQTTILTNGQCSKQFTCTDLICITTIGDRVFSHYTNEGTEAETLSQWLSKVTPLVGSRAGPQA